MNFVTWKFSQLKEIYLSRIPDHHEMVQTSFLGQTHSSVVPENPTPPPFLTVFPLPNTPNISISEILPIPRSPSGNPWLS